MEHNWKAGYFIYCTDTLILGAQFTNGFWIEELKEISKNKNLLCPKHTFTKFLPAFHANMGNDFPDIVAAGFLLGFWMHKYLGELTSKQILLCIWGRNSVIPFFLIFFSPPTWGFLFHWWCRKCCVAEKQQLCHTPVQISGVYYNSD